MPVRTCAFAYDFNYYNRKDTNQRSRRYTISKGTEPILICINAEGRRRNMKNMASILSMSDIAVLVIDATNRVSEERKNTNTMWDHLLMAFAFGIKYIVVAVNKMDLIEYSEKKYQDTITQLQPLLKRYGWSDDCTTFVPVSSGPCHGTKVQL
jgi:translation elongation factor EF-1alpha